MTPKTPSTNSFYQSVIEEEDAIREERNKINNQIKVLEDKIALLKKNDAFFYRQRKYCKFSDGYSCKFTGDCTHKEKVEGYVSIFGKRCFAETHAREAIS